MLWSSMERGQVSGYYTHSLSLALPDFTRKQDINSVALPCADPLQRATVLKPMSRASFILALTTETSCPRPWFFQSVPRTLASHWPLAEVGSGIPESHLIKHWLAKAGEMEKTSMNISLMEVKVQFPWFWTRFNDGVCTHSLFLHKRTYQDCSWAT